MLGIGVLPRADATTAVALAELQDLVKKGRSADALRRIDALLRQQPNDSELLFQKGLILAEQKHTAEAIGIFERLGKENPSWPEPLNNLAVLYAEQGQMDKARSALEAAVRSKPSYGTAYQNLTSVNVRMASRAYSRALQIDDSQGAPKLALIRNLGEAPVDAGERAAMLAAATRADATRSNVPAAASAPPHPTAPSRVATAATPAASPPSPSVTPPPAPVTGPPKTPVASEPVATASASQRQATDEAREVNAAVRAWAAAWARKDVESYIESYVPEFRANDRNPSAWQHGRRQRILAKNRISVELSGLTVEVTADRARASFRQDYSGDSLVVSSQKTLELVKRGGRWLIRKETVGS